MLGFLVSKVNKDLKVEGDSEKKRFIKFNRLTSSMTRLTGPGFGETVYCICCLKQIFWIPPYLDEPLLVLILIMERWMGGMIAT